MPEGPTASLDNGFGAQGDRLGPSYERNRQAQQSPDGPVPEVPQDPPLPSVLGQASQLPAVRGQSESSLAMEYTEDIQQAIAAVQRANEYAFTFAHPAYRDAEARLRSLGTAEAAIVLQATGGLKSVIGRGIRAEGGQA